MNWDNIEIKDASQNKSKAEFMSFPEGLSTIRIVSQPIQRRAHWLQSASVSVDCLGSGCPVCEMNKQAEAAGEAPKSKARNLFMFYVIDRNDNKLKIVEQGISFIKNIKILQDTLKEDGQNSDITSFDIKVRRTGMTAQNTTYVLRETKETPLTQEEQEMVNGARPIKDVPLKPNQSQMLELLSGKTVKDVFQANQEVDFTK